MGHLPRWLQSYLLGVPVAGLLLFGVQAAAWGPLAWRLETLPWLVVFVALAILAGQYPLLVVPGLIRGSKLSLRTAATFAGLLLVGTPAAMVAFGAATLVSNVALKRRWYNALFNAGQTLLHVGCAGAVYFALVPSVPARFDAPLSLVALPLAALTYYVVNTALVAVPFAHQAKRDVHTVWLSQRRHDVLPEAALFLLGVLAAVTVEEYPWVLGLIVLSVVGLYLALKVALEEANRARTAERLAREQAQQVVLEFAEVVDDETPYTRGHSRRVAEVAVQLARALGCPPAEIEAVRLAALVHDVGKQGLPIGPFLKAGPLTAEERATINQHPERGARIVGRVAEHELVTGIVRGHHERWDGAGYPDGLAGEGIPRGARVLAVADAFDALTSPRPYRPPLTVREAVAELVRCRGQQHDPAVVDALVQLYVPELAAARAPELAPRPLAP